MNGLFALFRPVHVAKFLAVMKRDGIGEAMRRARYFAGLILRHRGRSEFQNTASGLNQRSFQPFWDHAARNGAFHLTKAPATLSRKRKIAVIGDLNLPQCRKYRVEQLCELWGIAEVEVEFAHYEDFLRAAHLMQWATHLILYRMANSELLAGYLYEAHRLKLPIMYDIDDPLFSISAYATYGNADNLNAGLRAHFLRQAPSFATAINACDIVSVSTPELARHTREYTNRPVHVRRNFADSETLDAGRRAIARVTRKGSANTPFTIAFASGSIGRESDFDTVAKELEQFICDAPARRLMILGQFPWEHLSPRLAGRTVTRPFSDYQSYMRSLAEADCAVVPLADDLFNRCKSGVRVIDASAVAVPSLVPPVGDAQTHIENGISGRVIQAAGGWAAALEDLAANRHATREMGVHARHHLEKVWSAALREPIVDKAVYDWVLG